MRYEVYFSESYAQPTDCLLNAKKIGEAITLRGVNKMVKNHPAGGYFEVLDKFGFRNRKRFKK